MTEKLLRKALKKMEGLCEGKVQFGYFSSGVTGDHRISRTPPREVEQKDDTILREKYSPAMSLCQLVDWCEAWLKGFEEAKAAYTEADSAS